jgi:hypothetical protein
MQDETRDVTALALAEYIGGRWGRRVDQDPTDTGWVVPARALLELVDAGADISDAYKDVDVPALRAALLTIEGGDFPAPVEEAINLLAGYGAAIYSAKYGREFTHAAREWIAGAVTVAVTEPDDEQFATEDETR